MAISYIGRTDLPRGIRNNNPGNLRSGDDWKGEWGIDVDGFVIFSDQSWGLRALARDLSTKYGRGLNTVREIITEYAPPSENDTAAYVNFVSDKMGISPDRILVFANDLPKLMRWIIMHENGAPGSIVSDAAILEGINLAGNNALSVSKEAAGQPLVRAALIMFLAALGYDIFRKK